MKRFIFIFLFLITTLEFCGQSFDVLFQAEDSLNLSSGPVLELGNETSLILINAFNCILPTCTLFNSFYHIDRNGNIISKNNLPYYVCDVKVIDNEHFIVLGFKYYNNKQNTGSYFLFSIIYTNNLELISKDSISLNSNNFGSGEFCLTSNKIFFYVINKKYNYFSDYVFKAGMLNVNYGFPDSLINFEYHETSQIVGISDFLVASDKTMYFFAPYYGIIKYNPSNQLITKKQFQKSNFIADYNALWIDSTTMIVGGSADNTPIGQITHVQDFMILKCNTEFTTIKSLEIKKFPRYNFGGAVNCISKTDNGYYYAGTVNRIESQDFSDSSYIYIAKINDNLETEWERQIGGIGIRWVNSLTTTKKGGCIVAASVYNSETGLWDINIFKFNSSGDYNNINLQQTPQHFSLYPNPGSEGFYMYLPEIFDNTIMDVYQSYGQKLLTQKITTRNNFTSMQDYRAGIYLITITQNGKIIVKQKWIKTL